MAIRSKTATVARPKNKTITRFTPESSESRGPVSRMAIRLIAVGCLGLGAIASTGCSTTSGMCKAFDQSECIDEFMISYRNRAMAEKAWICNKERFCKRPNHREFKDGFIQGYMEVANGGNGCVPAVCPPEYWGWRYQSAGGQAAVNAWFEGFPMGVQAAEQDGIGHWQNVSPMGMAPPAALAPTMVPAATVPEVANPFYSDEEEFLPTPEPELDSGVQNAAPQIDELQMESPEAVFNEAFEQSPFAVDANGSDELISQDQAFDESGSAFAATLDDQMDDFPAPSEVVIDDIFGTPTPVTTDSDSDELPFSFE